MALHIHPQGRFNNHTAHNLYMIMFMAISVVGVMKMGNIVHRVGIKPTSLEFRASVTTITPCRLPDVATIPTPNCLCSSLPQRSMQTTTLLCLAYYLYLTIWRKFKILGICTLRRHNLVYNLL